MRLGHRRILTIGLFVLCVATARAYSPGSGTLYSQDFDGTLDPDWEMGNGFGSPSPWEQRQDGTDQSFWADGQGPFGGASTRHWARRALHPTPATSFSMAFEFRGELGAGYGFHTDIEERSPVTRKYRLGITADGTVTLSRTEAGVLTQVASTAPGTVPAGIKRWVRFAVEPGGEHPWIRARVWDGGAGAEPATWTLEYHDDLDTLARINRFELEADGPRGVQTWIDDLDLFGDPGNGVSSSVTEIWIAELSHLDIGFTEPPDDIEAFAKTHLDTVLNNLDADPDYRWYIESGWWLDEWWARSSTPQHDRMLDALRGGRIELGAGYANQTTTMVGHEQLIRNVYGSSALAREHGFPLRTWITDDVPGSSFALPEILARSGIDYYVGGMNTGFGGRVSEPDHGDRPFWWVGPDGSRVLSWITFDSYAEAFQYGFSFFDNLAAMYDKLGQKLPELDEVGYPYPELMLLRGFDNHYQGFHARNLINQWNATYATPQFRLATPSEFLDMMHAKYGEAAFPSYSGDFGAAWARGRSQTPHTTRLVREAHRDARAAEAAIAAGAGTDGHPAPLAALTETYRLMLESDEHTGAGGWPGYFTREEMDRNNRMHLGYAVDAASSAAGLRTDGIDRMVADLPVAGDAVVVINTLGRDRDAWARVALPPAVYAGEFRVIDRTGGDEIPFQRFDSTSEILFRAAAVPSFGYRVFDLHPGAPTATPPGTLQATSTTLENDHYLLTVDPSDGSLSSLVAKGTGKEMVDGASNYDFNELGSSTKSQYDGQQPPTIEAPASASVTIDVDGPLVAALRVTRQGTPHVETVYRLYRGEDRVEIENVLDRDLAPYVPRSIAVRAYVTTMPFDIHDFQLRTETTTRYLDPIGDSFARTSVFDYHNAEHTLAMWDDTSGVLYAVDASSAHHIENLSSLASGVYSTGDALMLSRLYDRVDEYEFSGGAVDSFVLEPDTDPILRFVHHVRGTAAAFDPVETSRFGFEALTPVYARHVTHRPGNLPDDAAGFVRVDLPGAVPYTLKPADVGEGVVLRILELEGVARTARVTSDTWSLETPERVEHDEDGGSPLVVDGDGFLVPIGPYETATVRFRPSPTWSPVTLHLGKAGGAVRLTWSGGVSPYTVERAEDPGFTTGDTVVLDEQPVSEHDDPVLLDGGTYFYLVR